MLRKATIQDIKIIHKMLAEYGKKGVLLSRPLSELYDHVRDFTIFEDKNNNKILGFGALQFCWEDLAEIRSLAIHENHKGKQIGSKLVLNAINEAKLFNIKKIFTLTYQPDFFKKIGFTEIDINQLPIKIWADCIICVKYPDCDETALLKEIKY